VGVQKGTPAEAGILEQEIGIGAIISYGFGIVGDSSPSTPCFAGSSAVAPGAAGIASGAGAAFGAGVIGAGVTLSMTGAIPGLPWPVVVGGGLAAVVGEGPLFKA
jgi:hypothetical protein